MKKSLFYIVMFFFVQVLATAVAFVGNALVNGSDTPMTTTWTVVLQLVFALSCIVLFLWRRWTPVSSLRMTAGTDSAGAPTPVSAGRAVTRGHLRASSLLAWTVVAALGTIIPSLLLQECLSFLPDIVSEDLMPIMMHPLGYLAIGIVVPVSEEIVFRGAILRELLSWVNRNGQPADSRQSTRRAWAAITLSALFFGLAHINPAQIPHAFLLGLMLGWLYWRSGSILPCVALHVTNNTVAFLIARSYPYMDDLTVSQMLGGSDRHVLMAVVFSLCLLLPALYQLHQRMQK
jgi:membrane protease YdiL (CAAX protease family)